MSKPSADKDTALNKVSVATRRLLLTGLSIVLTPVMLISIFGPLINRINTLYLEHRLNQVPSVDYAALKSVLENEWSFALFSYNTQMFTLLLAYCFIFIEFGRIFLPVFRKHRGEKLSELISQSTTTVIVISTMVLMILVGGYTFLSGMFSSPKIVALYLQGDLFSETIKFPPIESPITIARGIIVLQGLLLYYWDKRSLPSIFHNNTNDKTD